MAISQTTSFFCIPLPGKPNPMEAISNQPRSRVKQSGQKGDTCVYYALQILRDENRIGKNCPPEKLEKREIEKKVSQLRKNITKIPAFRSDDIVLDFAENINNSLPKNVCTKGSAQKILLKINNLFNPGHEESKKLASDALKSFISQNEFDDFLPFAIHEHDRKYYEKMIEAYNSFLQEFSSNIKLNENYFLNLLGIKSENLKLFEKCFIKQMVAHSLICDLYEMKKSSWHPNQPISCLVRQLELHGPHFIYGSMGPSFYEEPPIELDTKVEGRTVFAWQPSAKRKGGNSHAVVVVGADEKTSRVYYLDPIDESTDIKSQKLYAMSYTRLKDVIENLHGYYDEKFGKKVFEQELETENNYALHN